MIENNKVNQVSGLKSMILFDITRSKTNSLNRIVVNWNWSYLLKMNRDLTLLCRVGKLCIMKIRCKQDIPQ